MSVSSRIKEEIASAIYAGHPVDAMNYVSLFNMTGLGEDIYYTQDAVWCISRGDSLGGITPIDYYYALRYYAQSTEFDRYWGATGGTPSISGDRTLYPYGNIYKTGILTVTGDYNGNSSDKNIELDLPSGYAMYDAVTNAPVSKLAKGDRFYIVYNGSEPDGEYKDIELTYYTSKVWYYRSGDNVHQNMVELERIPHNTDFRLTFDTPKTSVSVKKEWSDGAEIHALDSVVVRLMADGVYTNKSLVLSKLNQWSGVFDNLPVLDSDGDNISYSIEENPVPGYEAVYYVDTSGGGSPEPTIGSCWVPATGIENGETYAIVYGANAVANASGEALSASPVIIGGSIEIDGAEYPSSISDIPLKAQWVASKNGHATLFSNASTRLPMKMKYRYSQGAASFVAADYTSGYGYDPREYYEFDGNFYINTDGTIYTSSTYAGVRYMQNAGAAVTSGGTAYTLYKKVSGEILEPEEEPEIQTITILNSKSSIQMNMKKVSESETPIKGAEFALYRAQVSGGEWSPVNPETPLMTAVSRANGNFAFFDLMPGNYLLYETKAVAGYMLPDEPWHVTVSNSGISVQGIVPQDDVFTIVNYRSYTLPAAGGPGLAFVYTLGGILIALSLVMAALYRKNYRGSEVQNKEK